MPKKGQSTTTFSEPYFLVVEGKRGPKVPLADIGEAREQAQRLHARNEGLKRVFILATIDVVEANTPSESTNGG